MKNSTLLLYQGENFRTLTSGSENHTIFRVRDQLLTERVSEPGSSKNTMLASDAHGSILNTDTSSKIIPR